MYKNQRGFVGTFILLLITVGIAGLIYEFWSGNLSLNNFDLEKPFQQQSNKVPWSDAVKLFKECKIKNASQTQYLEVFLELKDGKQVRSTEPQLGEISREIKSARSVCGEVMESTE